MNVLQTGAQQRLRPLSGYPSQTAMGLHGPYPQHSPQMIPRTQPLNGYRTQMGKKITSLPQPQ